MAFSSLKLNSTPSLPRVATREHSSIKPQASLQFERRTPKISLNGGNNISRRDALSCLTGTIVLTSLIHTEPANARIARPDIRRKIMEKLELLREKAGLRKKESAPKEEKKLPKLEKKDGSKLPKEEKKEPSSESKEQPKLVEAYF